MSVKLTIDDKQKNEMQKEVFVLIRLIDMLEKCVQYSYARITPQDHVRQVSMLLQKYEQFKSKIANFNLNKFVAEYNLEECKFGLDRIREGVPRNQENKSIQFVRLTEKFYKFHDLFFQLDNNQNRVKTFKPSTEELIDLLQQAQNQLPPYNSYLKELIDFNNRVFSQKQLMDQLNANELEELEAIVNEAHTNFSKAVNN